jgi:hypothetical protein
MSRRIHAMADAIERLAGAFGKIRTAPVAVKVTARPPSDRVQAQRRSRLEDPKEIAALKRRLGLPR